MRSKKLEVCELCGKFSINLTEAIVEGAMISVCKNCSHLGNIITVDKPNLTQEILPKRKIVVEKESEEFNILVPDFAQKIQQTREKLNLKQEELAQKIAERESVIHNIESGHLKPPFLLAKKLENFLKIKLIETYKEEKSQTLNFSDKHLTIGDLLKLKK